MLSVSEKFRSDIQSNTYSITPLIVIDKENNPVYISTSRGNFITDLVPSTSNFFEDYDLKISNISESVSLDTRTFKTNKVNFSLTNYPIKGTRISDLIQEFSLINKYVDIYYKTQSCETLEDCTLVYRGIIKSVKHDAKRIQFQLEDLTEDKLTSEVPIGNLGYTRYVHNSEYINKPIPIHYGEWNGDDKAPAVLWVDKENPTLEGVINVITDDVLNGARGIQLGGVNSNNERLLQVIDSTGNNPLYVFKDEYYKVLETFKEELIHDNAMGNWENPSQYIVNNNYIQITQEYESTIPQNPPAFNEFQTVKERVPNKMVVSGATGELGDELYEIHSTILNPTQAFDGDPNLMLSSLYNLDFASGSSIYDTFARIPDNTAPLIDDVFFNDFQPSLFDMESGRFGFALWSFDNEDGEYYDFEKCSSFQFRTLAFLNFNADLINAGAEEPKLVYIQMPTVYNVLTRVNQHFIAEKRGVAVSEIDEFTEEEKFYNLSPLYPSYYMNESISTIYPIHINAYPCLTPWAQGDYNRSVGQNNEWINGFGGNHWYTMGSNTSIYQTGWWADHEGAKFPQCVAYLISVSPEMRLQTGHDLENVQWIVVSQATSAMDDMTLFAQYVPSGGIKYYNFFDDGSNKPFLFDPEEFAQYEPIERQWRSRTDMGNTINQTYGDEFEYFFVDIPYYTNARIGYRMKHLSGVPNEPQNSSTEDDCGVTPNHYFRHAYNYSGNWGESIPYQYGWFYGVGTSFAGRSYSYEGNQSPPYLGGGNQNGSGSQLNGHVFGWMEHNYWSYRTNPWGVYSENDGSGTENAFVKQRELFRKGRGDTCWCIWVKEDINGVNEPALQGEGYADTVNGDGLYDYGFETTGDGIKPNLVIPKNTILPLSHINSTNTAHFHGVGAPDFQNEEYFQLKTELLGQAQAKRLILVFPFNDIDVSDDIHTSTFLTGRIKCEFDETLTETSSNTAVFNLTIAAADLVEDTDVLEEWYEDSSNSAISVSLNDISSTNNIHSWSIQTEGDDFGENHQDGLENPALIDNDELWNEPNNFNAMYLNYNLTGNTDASSATLSTSIYDIGIVHATIFTNVLEAPMYVSRSGRLGEDENLLKTVPDILTNFLETELNLINMVDEASVSTASSLSIGHNYAFSINEVTKSKSFINDLMQSTNLAALFKSTSEFAFLAIPSIPTTKNNIIKVNDIINYQFRRTGIEKVNTLVNVKYKYDYAKDEFLKETGYIDGYDMFGNGDGYITDGYSYDYLGIEREDKALEFETKYIRDENTALALRNFLYMQNCNQHNMFDISLPIKYIMLEVGDIIEFDNLIDDMKAYGEDYTVQNIRNGQIISPYFMITSVARKEREISIKCTQLHNLERTFTPHIGSVTRNSGTKFGIPEFPIHHLEDVELLTDFLNGSEKYFTREQRRISDVITSGYINIHDLNYLNALVDGTANTDEAEQVGGYTIGDVNLDGVVNIVDVVALVNTILEGEYEIEDLQYADLNNDGTINVVDIIGLINQILS